MASPARRPFVVGLIGGIASGKSTVSKCLGRIGLKIIDADKLGHKAYEPGTRCHSKLVKQFGNEIVAADGTIDRRILGDKVFSNPSDMSQLQSIVWPEIRRMTEQRLADMHHVVNTKETAIVLEAAVLLDAGWDDLCDELWAVQVSPETAKKRLMKRNNLSAEEADKRLASQPMTNEERAKRVQVVLENEGTEEELETEVWDTWQSRKPLFIREAEDKYFYPVFLALLVFGFGASAASAKILYDKSHP